MTRTTYRWCTICGGTLHQVDAWPSNCMPEENYAKSDLPAPYVISDSLPGGVNGLYHHGVARKIDSKSGYRRATKESGCIEVGNEREHRKARAQVEIKEAVIEQAVNDALNEVGIDDGADDVINFTPEQNMGKGVFSAAN